MAELDASTADCCARETQESCCESAAKAACCGDQHARGCGCGAGAEQLPTGDDLRETIRQKYAAVARAAADGKAASCSPADDTGTFGASLYADENADVPETAVGASLGC